MPRRKRRARWPLRLAWLSGCVALGLFVALAIGRRLHPGGSAPSLANRAPRRDWAQQLPTSIEAINQSLSKLALRKVTPELHPRGAGAVKWVQRNFDVPLDAPMSLEEAHVWFDGLEEVATGVGVKIVAVRNGLDVLIGVDGLLTHSLSFHWPGRQSRAAIVLTGIGDNLQLARRAAGLRHQLTLAIDPRSPFARQAAEIAKLEGVELLGAWSRDRPTSESEAGSDLPLDSLRQVRLTFPDIHAFSSEWSRADFAKGEVLPFLTRARELGLFVLDSVGDLCGADIDRSLPCVGRDIRIGADATPESLRISLESMLALTQARGDVTLVAPATAAMLDSLRAFLPELAAAHVQLVPFSVIAAERASLLKP